MSFGQASMNTKSMFGAQAPSHRRSAPAHGFGGSTRNHAAKLFMGSQLSSNISCTPGPCYEIDGACGNQADSGKTSPPQWQFGTESRMRSRQAARSPGPGAYDGDSAFGKQGNSSRTTFPIYGFGSVDRGMAQKVFISPQHSASKYGQQSPGPAAMYSKPGGMAGPKFGFGTDDRFNRLARQLGDAAEQPGPGAYEGGSVFGANMSSRLESTSRYGFGTSNREHMAKVFVSDMASKSSSNAA